MDSEHIEPDEYGAIVEVRRGVWIARWCLQRPDLDTPWISTVDPNRRASWREVIERADAVSRLR